jgi:hypothetical protein
MIPQLKAVLSSKAAEWGLPANGDWSFLVHNNYQPTCSTFNVLWFHRKDSYPRAVTKVCRQQDVLSREFQSLQAIYPLAQSHVPRPLDLQHADGFWLLWMAGVPGTRMPRRSNYPLSTMISIVDMLTAIHRGAREMVMEPTPDRYASLVANPLEALSGFGGSTAVGEGCAAALKATSGPWINSVAIIPQHGDIFVDNVLCHKGEWHVVDWETFGAIDLPFYDLLTLLLSMLRASGDTPDRLDPKLVRQVPFLVHRYARALELPVCLVPVLLPLTMANWFYLHWVHRHKVAMEVMYSAADKYFQHKQRWDEIFVGG